MQLLIMAPSQKAMASREWSLATCHMLQDLATKVTDRMHEEGAAAPCATCPRRVRDTSEAPPVGGARLHHDDG